jgi:hypothetical protein
MTQLGSQAYLVSLHSNPFALGVARNSACHVGRQAFRFGDGAMAITTLYSRSFAAMDVLAANVNLVLSQWVARLLA